MNEHNFIIPVLDREYLYLSMESYVDDRGTEPIAFTNTYSYRVLIVKRINRIVYRAEVTGLPPGGAYSSRASLLYKLGSNVLVPINRLLELPSHPPLGIAFSGTLPSI